MASLREILKSPLALHHDKSLNLGITIHQACISVMLRVILKFNSESIQPILVFISPEMNSNLYTIVLLLNSTDLGNDDMVAQ